jgi:hypothetical protein
MDKMDSFARAMFGGPLTPEAGRNTTPGTRTGAYYQDNPNYPYPRGMWPDPPPGYAGPRAYHRETGLPAYPVPAHVIPRGEEGFYRPYPDDEAYVTPDFPPEWRTHTDENDEDGEGDLAGEKMAPMMGMAGSSMTAGELAMFQRLLQQRAPLLPPRVGQGAIPSDPYRGTFDRVLPEPED